MCETGSTAPVSPTSPSATKSCGIGTSRLTETTAKAAAKSAAVSRILKPPATFTYTSSSANGIRARFCKTASKTTRRL